MRAISWIAVNVFKESVRDRVPYNLALFAVLMIASSFLIGQLTAGQDVKIIKDLGLAAIAVFGLFIAIFIGIAHASLQQKNYRIPLHILHSFFSQPDPVYRGARRTD